ncbi:hypothetical protein PNIG_b0358 [Pseudoalteromonas nigrifaciens]|uniref:Orphan protein n=2 Tax=Pseudoalteromonas TaxID=53246 RepID=Q3ID94_PSET1|nr:MULTISPECIES: hypothetical protein [Pseudoalteromonas]ASM55962.1 hypothetical protein PNIG_b0358 [Pseudoalteromonas nigrifaciens]MBB1372182.1 hypothetical protein [Pseudoalteromonas sp. SR45-4]MBB1405183.1 hypothetical protein [Pseudoalteromonas sp. SG44-5]MBE0420952.1 hypothetical protein [Pseudoalteromonas nigrifaciens]MBH0092306.1 hypothetical protein [Pseudoalteromonas sp. SCQQ13]
MKNKLLPIATIFFLSACGSTQQPQSTPFSNADTVPSWVLMPSAPEGGLASSSCVPWSGNMAASRAQAVASARADLATQINSKAQVLDTLINKQMQQQDSVQTQSSFTQVSRQTAEESLVGSIAKEVSFAQINNQKQLCALVIMENTKPIFDKLIEKSGKNLSPNDEDMLYREFRLQQTTEELNNLAN